MKKPKKHRRRRHLVVAFLLFAGMGALVALAHLRPPVNLPVDESPEMLAKRLDEQNNAWYLLLKATELVPDPPPPLELKDEEGWPYKYAAKEGSIGRLLYTARPDDDPLLIEYVGTLGPARELALQALEKPYFLRPTTPADPEVALEMLRRRRDVWDLANLFLAEAIRHPCSDDPATDACEHLFNAWRILAVIDTDDSVPYDVVRTTAVDVIRKAAPAHSPRLAQWLDRCRLELAPPLNELEHQLRSAYAASAEAMLPNKDVMPGLQKTVLSVLLARDKRMLLRSEKSLREIAPMTHVQFEQFIREHPEFEEYGVKVLNDAPRPHRFLWHNSSSLATLDGLAIALALQRFKLDQGAYPETLDALVPNYLAELPKTPFTGGPYIYARQNEDYSLTCVGGPHQSNRWREDRDIFVIHQPPKSDEQ